MGLFGGHGVLAWALFNLLVLGLLVLDLGVFNRKSHVVGFREALAWNVVWTGLGLAFGGVVFGLYGRQPGLEYVTGYVVERALSFDNIFVFVVVFGYFRVESRYQHRVLYWGILTALVFPDGRGGYERLPVAADDATVMRFFPRKVNTLNYLVPMPQDWHVGEMAGIIDREVKKEKPDKCEQCNKALSRVKWYYRNNGYYCTTRCWKEFRAKQQEAAQKAGSAAAPKA